MNTNIVSLDGVPFISTASQGGYIALGYSGNCSFVFSLIQQRVVALRPSHMNEMTLKSVCGADWCEENYYEMHPRKEEMFFNHKRLSTDIIAGCQRVGIYNESSERKCGVWPSADGSALYINGAQLWRNDGKVINNGILENKVYPRSGDIGFGPETESASQEDITKVLNAFGGYKWRTEMVPEMLLGWFVCAALAPSLKRRPHVYITAPAGTGKSVLLDIMGWMLGSLAHKASGPQTMAGLYQSIGGTSRAVVLDEAEADSSNRKWKDTLEVARISYSLSESDNGIVVGSQTGTPKNYRFFSAFLAAGITPAKFEAADLSRWAMFETNERMPGSNDPMTEQTARTLGARLAVLAVRRWSVLQASLDVIRNIVMQEGGDARLADSVAPLLAGYWTMVSDKAATANDAETLVGLCGLKKHKEQREETDEKRCLEALMTRVMPMPLMVENCLVRQPISLAEAVNKVCENPSETLELQNRMCQLGLRVKFHEGRWVIMVANSPEHTELRKLFRGTKWQYGGWSVTLRRLPGGQEATQRLGLKTAKITMFDVPADYLPVNDESDDLMAA